MLLTTLMRVALTRSFNPFAFRNTRTEWLDYDRLNSLGLYVHIPFCRSLCGFCPYCKVLYDERIAAEYKEALLNEISMVAAGHEKKKVTSLYFGGGSPALMLDDLRHIIDRIKEYYIICDDIGVELHPNDINEETLSTLKSAGVSMISVGVQSFNAGCLNALGREERDCAHLLRMVKEWGFRVIDVDLLFAIPGQTEETLKRDIEMAFAFGATQVSTYPFISFTFADSQCKPMPERIKKRMLSEITVFTRRTGKRRTSIWTFAQEGAKKYSSVTRDSFLGFGVSAATLLKHEFKINTFSIPAYIDRIRTKQLPTSLTLHFTIRQRACYYLFWSAYSMRLDKKQFEDMLAMPVEKMFGFELWLCKRLGFVLHKDDGYYLTDKGAYYFHYIEQEYTTAYIDKMWNISRIEAFPDKIVLN